MEETPSQRELGIVAIKEIMRKAYKIFAEKDITPGLGYDIRTGIPILHITDETGEKRFHACLIKIKMEIRKHNKKGRVQLRFIRTMEDLERGVSAQLDIYANV